MAGESLVAARRMVRDIFGPAVEQKATDEFCITHARRSRGLEITEAVAPRATILEFTPPPQGVDPRRPEAAIVLEQLPGTVDPAVWGRLRSALRREAVIRQRDDFDRDVSAVRARLEEADRHHAPERPALEAALRPPATVEVCWLNRTVRAVSDRDALADVVEDAKIATIDLARPLMPDVFATAGIVGAPNYRTVHNLTGKDVIVAVIDSEVALNHSAFGGRVAHRDNYTKESWGHPGSHGTAVAGIVGSNDPSCLGIAPDVTIYNYKVIATDNTLNADDFGGSRAIQQALEDGALIANCSWGTGPAGDGTSREARACNTAWANGLTIVKSAGNKGPGAQTLTTPADADGVIAVGATNRKGTAIERYSSRGPTPGGLKRPHLVAPGGEQTGSGITSCLIAGGFGDTGAGTSYAAPHVSGLLALLLEAAPDSVPDSLRNRLLGGCSLLAGVSSDAQGAGLIVLV